MSYVEYVFLDGWHVCAGKLSKQEIACQVAKHGALVMQLRHKA